MLTRRQSLGLMGTAAAALLQDSWGSSTTAQTRARPPWEVWETSSTPVRGGYFRRAAALDVGLLNPNHWPVNDWLVISQIHEKLLITDGSYRPVPWLAESWHFHDPVTCVMKLRRGVAFSDGTPFNAAAVKFVEEWITDPKNGCWTAGWLKPLKAIDVVDEHTVRWRFHEPWGSFLGVMANVPGYMMSPAALRDDPKRYDTQPVGTGPYILEDRSAGSWIKLRRNPRWWFGASVGRPAMPYFDGVLTTVIPDPAVQLATLRAGKLDGLLLDKAQYDSARTDPKLVTYVTPANHVRAYTFNHSKPPFHDIRVRQAIAYAIDRKALVAGIEFGMGRLASCMYPDDHWAHNPALKPWPFDRERARQLLRDAGYAGGLTINGYVAGDTQARARTEAIKAMLAEVGVTWNVDFLAPVAASDRLKNLEFQFAGSGWTFIFDPDLMASGLYHPTGGFNYGRNRIEAAIALIEQGRREVVFERRQKIYWELERVLYEQCADVWLFWEMQPSALGKHVMGFNHEMSVLHKEAWSWSHPLWFRNGRPA